MQLSGAEWSRYCQGALGHLVDRDRNISVVYDRSPDQSDMKVERPFYLVHVNSETREIKVHLYFKQNQPHLLSTNCTLDNLLFKKNCLAYQANFFEPPRQGLFSYICEIAEIFRKHGKAFGPWDAARLCEFVVNERKKAEETSCNHEALQLVKREEGRKEVSFWESRTMRLLVLDEGMGFFPLDKGAFKKMYLVISLTAESKFYSLLTQKPCSEVKAREFELLKQASNLGKHSDYMPEIFETRALQNRNWMVLTAYAKGPKFSYSGLGSFHIARKIAFFVEILEGVRFLHEELLVFHRDLKPDNVVLEEDDGGEYHAKLIDLGLSTPMAFNGTCSIDVLGTPLYKSPEQYAGERLTPKCDVFSVGGIAFEVLNGVLPWDEPGLTESKLKGKMRSAFFNNTPLVEFDRPMDILEATFEGMCQPQPRCRFTVDRSIIQMNQALLRAKS